MCYQKIEEQLLAVEIYYLSDLFYLFYVGVGQLEVVAGDDSDVLDQGVVETLLFIVVEYLILFSCQIDLDCCQALLLSYQSQKTTFSFKISQFDVVGEVLTTLVFDEETGDEEELGFALRGYFEFHFLLFLCEDVVVDWNSGSE